MTVRDTTGPEQVDLISPTSGTSITISSLSLARSTAIDSGVGTTGYFYQVSSNASFSTTVISGTTKTETGVSLIGFSNGTYYRRVYAIDSIGNTGVRSSIRSFIIAIPTNNGGNN